jgi:mannobiose 2-epimerase
MGIAKPAFLVYKDRRRFMLNREEAIREVTGNILPFWQGMADTENGGFFGEADFSGEIHKTADKGGILNSRILWTFSAAYNIFKDESYKASAARAKEFLVSAFVDKTHGGLYWLADHKGKALDTRKQFYNIAFGIYALAEHFRATGDQSSLDLAHALFDVTESHGFDPEAGGYIEACNREWRRIDDNRLSDKDLNSPKSMNTNLHVLEAYTTLVRAGGDNRVRKALEGLLRVTLDKIVSRNWNFKLFFNMDWSPLVGDISWGHDIEGSWLLYEAALAIGDEKLIAEVKRAALHIAEATYAAAVDRKSGGLLSGCDAEGKSISPKKEWWPQAEAVVGFYNAYELSGDQKYADAANGIWGFIQNHFVDRVHGEWHNEISPDNTPDSTLPKAGFWKCPYHNARACFEIIRRMAG